MAVTIRMNKDIAEKIYLIKNRKAPNEYKKTDSGIIPSDWESTVLGKRLRVFRGASPRPKGDPRYYGGTIPRLMIKDVTRDGKYAYPCIDSLTEEGAKKSRLLPKGSVVLSCSGTKVGIPGILGIDACIHDGFFGFDEFKDINPEYLYYFFDLLNIKLQASATRGGVFNNLTTDIMKEMNIAVPEKNEQDKIAEILATFDKIVKLKEKLLEEKQKQKKGLIERLLTGKIRLSGFNSKLREMNLDEVLVESNDVTTINNQYPVLTSSRKGIYIQSEYFSKQVASEENIGYKVIKNGEFTYRAMSDDGKFTFNQLTDYEIGIVSPAYAVFGVKSNHNDIFIKEILNSDIFTRHLAKEVQGGTRLSLKFKGLSKIRLKMPCLDEQCKIAEILNLSSKEIMLLEKEIESLKNQKKGLMQLLLTGIVRVKCD